MDRRNFAKQAMIASLAPGIGFAKGKAAAGDFGLKYAPHFGMFVNHSGKDFVDQLTFMHEQGFRAFEDNGMKGRTIADQEKIAQAMSRMNMEMGVFVAHKIYWQEPNLANGDESLREEFLTNIRESVEVAKRVNAKWMTVVPGHVDLGLEMPYQTAHVIESLKRASDILEPHGLTMVLEPLNWWANHAGQFLTGIPQAYEICKAVDSPACKILFDIYHQQITEGNIIPNIDKAWEEIGYFQVGDNPGRKEPGTGEINYLNVFNHLKSKDFQGIVGMEHGNSQDGKEGEEMVINAYRKVDES